MKVNHGEYQELVDNLKSNLIKSCQNKLNTKQLKAIDLAFDVANHAHYGQFRKSGEPYITHPLEVATILGEWGLDEKTIAAALMHDVLEDTKLTKEELVRIFDSNIADLVDSVTKLDKLHFETEEIAHAEYFRKVVLAMAKDLRVILIKLADRMHNMQTLGSMRPEKRKKIALETMEIYVPIADKIGLHRINLELAEESFKHLYPYRYRILSTVAEEEHQKRWPQIQEIMESLTGALESNGINATFKYRNRTIHNIYMRMRKRGLSFNQIYDLFEFKIIVATIGECYLSLGVSHSIYQPFQGKFKDYIAIPKANGYQSLHTTLMGPKGRPIKIHIRTQEMDEIAEYGIISQLIQSKGTFEKSHTNLSPLWLNNILDIQSSTFSATEFLENIKKDLAPTNIYVFTPRGKIIHLPLRSTPIDFAYSIHTDIGNHIAKARVNQLLVPLNQPLNNGDVVEIITALESEPSYNWLEFVVSGKAISKIKQYLKEQKVDEDVTNGLTLLNLGLNLLSEKTHLNDRYLAKFIKNKYPQLSLIEFEQKIGTNELACLKVVKELAQVEGVLTIKLSNCQDIIIQDEICCPLPEEEIYARITREGKLELHSLTCIRNRAIGLDKLQKIILINDINQLFLAKVSIIIQNIPGTFSQLSLQIASRQINMEEIFQERNPENLNQVIVRLTITTHSATEVNDLLDSLAENSFIIKATRS